MIGLGSGVRVYLAAGVTDMRKGIAGLGALAQNALHQNPACGAVIVFRGRKGDRVKLLYWDGQVLPLLQGSGAGAFPLAQGRCWRGLSDVGPAFDALGGD